MKISSSINYVVLVYTSNCYTHPSRTTRHMKPKQINFNLNLNVHNKLCMCIEGRLKVLKWKENFVAVKIKYEKQISTKDTERVKKPKSSWQTDICLASRQMILLCLIFILASCLDLRQEACWLPILEQIRRWSSLCYKKHFICGYAAG